MKCGFLVLMFNDCIIEDFYLRDVIVMKSLIFEIPADAWSQKTTFSRFFVVWKVVDVLSGVSVFTV